MYIELLKNTPAYKLGEVLKVINFSKYGIHTKGCYVFNALWTYNKRNIVYKVIPEEYIISKMWKFFYGDFK